MTQPLTNKNNTCVPSAAGMSNEGMGESTRVPVIHNGGGKSIRIRNPEHRAKAERFWTALSERRKQPGNCCRCGKSNNGEFRQCDPCRKRVAELKTMRHVKKLDLAQCVAIVMQCRREVTKLRQLIQTVRRMKSNSYQRGYVAGKANGLELAKYHGSMPGMSNQELAQISHAYSK